MPLFKCENDAQNIVTVLLVHIYNTNQMLFVTSQLSFSTFYLPGIHLTASQICTKLVHQKDPVGKRIKIKCNL